MPTCVLDLPYDVLHYVSSYLTVREYTYLSLVNHQLHQYLRNERTAKFCLEVSFLFVYASTKLTVTEQRYSLYSGPAIIRERS